MKKHNTYIILLFVLLALPIPPSLLSWIGTVMSLANIGMTDWSAPGQLILGLVALVTMLLAGTYVVSYVISLSITLKNKRISRMSLLPVAHLLTLGVFLMAWMLLE